MNQTATKERIERVDPRKPRMIVIHRCGECQTIVLPEDLFCRGCGAGFIQTRKV